MSALQDRRRILGPTDAVKLPLDTSTTTSEVDRARKPQELRKIFLQPGGVVNSNGSAYIEVGDIKLQCSVYGPSPIRGSFTELAQLTIETKVTPFAGMTSESQSAQLELSISTFVYTGLSPAILLDQYPKSCINVLVTVISAGNNSMSLLAAAINVASVALMNAGIFMRDVVTAGSAVEIDNTVYYDPECSNPSSLEAVVAFCTGRNNSITNVWIEGDEIEPEKFITLSDHALNVASQIRTLINGVMISEFQRIEKGSNES